MLQATIANISYKPRRAWRGLSDSLSDPVVRVSVTLS